MGYLTIYNCQYLVQKVCMTCGAHTCRRKRNILLINHCAEGMKLNLSFHLFDSATSARVHAQCSGLFRLMDYFSFSTVIIEFVFCADCSRNVSPGSWYKQ